MRQILYLYGYKRFDAGGFQGDSQAGGPDSLDRPPARRAAGGDQPAGEREETAQREDLQAQGKR